MTDKHSHHEDSGILAIRRQHLLSLQQAADKENYLKAAEMSMEDDYGMIDGIINNGKAVKDEPEKPSVVERLHQKPQGSQCPKCEKKHTEMEL